jgi:hypothetical protein
MTMVASESHVSWDVEGWVRSALAAWAREYEEIEIVRAGRFIEVLVDGVAVARVEVRKIPLLFA